MKRTAKNEQTNELNATTRRCERDDAGKKAPRSTDFSQALRRSTTALALTCGVCVGVCGCQSFLGGADERFRQGRGEYALNDEAVLRDWEQAARDAGETTRKGGIGEGGQNGGIGKNAENDPASSQPVLRSASFDETEERRVASRKPVFGEEPQAPKSFSERVKGLFSRPKKEPQTKGGEAKKSARSNEGGFSLGRGLPNVFSSSKRRGREKFPVDPVLQYDESRFMPNFQTCERYYSPIKARPTVERPLNSAELGKTEKTSQRAKLAQNVRPGGSVASKATQKRPNAPTRVSGRELVANSEKRQTALEDASAWATSGVASKTSATGWGKTRPIAVAANEESATAKAPVAPVGFMNAARKTETNIQVLTESCDRFFGWEADDAVLLNAIAEPTGEVGETLTAYSTAPSPNAPAFSAAVAAIATENGGNAATLTANATTEETTPFVQNAAPSSVAALAAEEPLAGVGEIAETAQVGESAPVLTAYSPSAIRKNANEGADFASQLGKTGFDWFDSQAQKGEAQPAVEAEQTTNVAAVESNATASVAVETAEKTKNEPLEVLAETPLLDLEAELAKRLAPVSVEGFEPLASALPVEPAPVAEVGELASALPVEPASVAEVGELASSLPVETAPVAEVGELTSSLPVEPAPIAEVGELTSSLPDVPFPFSDGAIPVAVETLDVEAPQALAAVEEVVGEENGVAGPNFALAAPGLGAGEAIQNAADERKDAAVAKPLTGDEIAWVGQIKSAIRTLVAERDAKKAAGEDVRRLDARLRLLYLAVDEYDRSIQEIQDDADPLKVFWENERGDLETLLQSRLEEIDPTFVAERLRAGLDSLSGLCDLQIRKSALVVAPACFGLYEERAEAFQPGETVFAYAELEYVSCRETEEGRLIDVECRWRLLNADGSELTPVETQRCSNLSETKLRDVVLNVSAPLPNDLAPGTYLLETEVVDMNRPSAKPATKRLELTVVAGENAEKAAE